MSTGPAESAATEEQWLAAAAAVLRRSGRLSEHDPDSAAWEKLATRTLEGLIIPPLGTPSRSASWPEPASPGRPPFIRGSEVRPHGWDIRPWLADPDALSAADAVQADLNGGATSLWIRVGGGGTAPDDLRAVLDRVYLDLAPITVSAAGAVSDLAAARAVAEVVGSARCHPATNLGADPIGRAVAADTGTFDLREVREIASLAGDLGVRAVTVDATVAHGQGAGDATELGYALAAGAAYLRECDSAGIGIDDALSLLEFRFAATDEQFLTIAKFRAARLLWDRVAELSGAAQDRPGQQQHAVTSWPMMTRYDSWTNLLRTTVAAFAAGVGGAQAVTVLPFDVAVGIPDSLGRRLARNISHLLISESHVAEATDPAGGAHAVEELTWSLAERAWTEFGRIEQAGGIAAALAEGTLVAGWAQQATDRRRSIGTRRRAITGVSEFPHWSERLPERRPGTGFPGGRWAVEFEELRDDPFDVPVFLATLGKVAAHNARSTFAANLFTAGGVPVVTAGATDSAADVLAIYDGQPAVCLVATDTSYAAWGPELIPALRAAGASWIAVAGKPSTEIDALLDDHFALGEDALAFLRRCRSAVRRDQLPAAPSRITASGEQKAVR